MALIRDSRFFIGTSLVKDIPFITLILMTLPGIFGTYLFCALSPTKKPSGSLLIPIWITMSVFCYIPTFILFSFLGSLFHFYDAKLTLINATQSLDDAFSIKTITVIAVACFFSIPLSITGILFLYKYPVIHILGLKLNLTSKTQHESNWLHTFADHKENYFAIVFLSNGSTFKGKIKYFSDITTERAFSLSEVIEYDSEGNDFRWPLEDCVFFANTDTISRIRFEYANYDNPSKENNNEQETTTNTSKEYQQTHT
ncbi:hypothetical protein JD969_05315 [Planctomycetota bacterium]|nr:hypothetical protein JD969_05315 [Planctomycetota bacterium]